MAKATKIRPPFAWLGQHTQLTSIVATMGIAAFFRFYELGSLPPGIDGQTATVGLQALNVLNHGTFPGLNAANDYAPLWVWLQSVAIYVFGHTALALRIIPAILGTIAVLTAWLWMKSWFNLRLAWLTAFLLAVTPWAVTLSRSGSEAVLWPLLVTLTLWLATRAWRSRSVVANVLLALVLSVNLLCGPIGWLITATTVLVAITLLWNTKRLFKFDHARLIGIVVLAAGLGLLSYLFGLSLSAIKALPQATGIAMTASSLGMSLLKTLLMFNVTGDQNYLHNLAAEPMLNAFVGLMLVAGIIVAISRLHERRYRLLFIFFLAFLIPSVLSASTAPNAARASGALPLVLAISAVGISYMLELWYQTFPINSAARLTGQLAIIALLGLTLFQGYTQYFRAWAGTSEVYGAYNEGAVQMSAYLTSIATFKGQTIVVATPSELPVIAYLDSGGLPYTPVQATGILKLPATAGTHQFIIAASSRDTTTKALKSKFPGGILYPHYSAFNQAEIYYTYLVTK